jgi:hypothetical protein
MAFKPSDPAARKAAAAEKLASYRAEQVRLKEGAASRRAAAAERAKADGSASGR